MCLPAFDWPVFDWPVFDWPVFDWPVFDWPAFANPCPPKPTRANTWVRPYKTKTLSYKFKSDGGHQSDDNIKNIRMDPTALDPA